MKNKLPKKPVKQKQRQSNTNAIKQQESKEEEEEEFQQSELVLLPKQLKKEALFVTFSGIIQRGELQLNEGLTLFYSIVAGADWIRVEGEKQAVSQIAGGDGQGVVWNLPFQIGYEMTSLVGWPQLVVSLYGTDFFGRSFIRGYGCMHLPSTAGRHTRKISIFQPLPSSKISGLFGYLSGCVAELKDVDKVMAQGEGREVIRCRGMGTITITVQTTKINFAKYGYE